MKLLAKIALMSCALMGTVFADPSDEANYANTSYPPSTGLNYSNVYNSSSPPLNKVTKSQLLTTLTPVNKALYDKMGPKGQDLALKLLNNECTTPDACYGFYYGPVRDADEAVRVAYEAMKSISASNTPPNPSYSNQPYRAPSQQSSTYNNSYRYNAPSQY